MAVDRPPLSLQGWAGAGSFRTGVSAGLQSRETRRDLAEREPPPATPSFGVPDPEYIFKTFNTSNCDLFTYIPYPRAIDGSDVPVTNLEWGSAVQAWQAYMIVGAQNYDGGKGIVNLYRFSTKIDSPDITLIGEANEGLGRQVAITNDRFAVGCARSDQLGDNYYAVKVYDFSGNEICKINLIKRAYYIGIPEYHGFGPGPIKLTDKYIFIGDPLYSRVRVYNYAGSLLASLSGGNLIFGLGTSLAVTEENLVIAGNPCGGQTGNTQESVTFWDCSSADPSSWQGTAVTIQKPSTPFDAQREVNLNQYETGFGFAVAITEDYLFASDGKGGVVDVFDHSGTRLYSFYNHGYNADLVTGPSLDVQKVNGVTQVAIGGTDVETYIFDGTEFTSLCSISIPTFNTYETPIYDVTSVADRKLAANTVWGEEVIGLSGQPGGQTVTNRSLWATNNIVLEGNRIYVGSSTSDVNGTTNVGEAFILGVNLRSGNFGE